MAMLHRDEKSLFTLADSFYSNSSLFKYKPKITSPTGNYRTKALKTMVPLKYLSSFLKTFQISLIKCEISLILTWSAKKS